MDYYSVRKRGIALRLASCRRAAAKFAAALLIAASVACDQGDLTRLPVGGIVSWDVARPEEHGLDAERLAQIRDTLAARRTTAFLVVRHGALVHEWYAAGHGTWRQEDAASLSKSLVAGMALLIALDDGAIDLDDRVWEYFGAWQDVPLKSEITIKHLATHSSGIGHGKGGERSGWEKAFWLRQPQLFSAVMHEAPVEFQPGTRYRYSGPAFAPLSYAITASLQGSPYSDIEAALRTRIMEPIGIPRSAWTIGYDQSFEMDGLKLYAGWSGARFTPRAVARVGQLMLQEGRWGEAQLVSPSVVGRMIRHHPDTPLPRISQGLSLPAPAICWWSNSNQAWEALPSDAFAGVGNGGQALLVVPSWDLLVVRFGEQLGRWATGPAMWSDLERYLFTPLAAVVVSAVDQELAAN